jgi:hypothetical protein
MHKEALRGAGSRPTSPRTTSKAAGPLIRIIPIAAGGAPLDSAKIVSGECIKNRYFLSLLFKPDIAALAPVSINC